nr:gas vesicle protein [Actinomadura rubrobrunea]
MPYTGTARAPARATGERSGTSLADLLERILDKGIVIVGDIQVNLLDIELLTIKLRLLVASVDRAKEMGIDWWEHDPSLSSRARAEVAAAEQSDREEQDRLAEENRMLRERLAALEAAVSPPAHQIASQAHPEAAGRPAARMDASTGSNPDTRHSDDAAGAADHDGEEGR